MVAVQDTVADMSCMASQSVVICLNSFPHCGMDHMTNNKHDHMSSPTCWVTLDSDVVYYDSNHHHSYHHTSCDSLATEINYTNITITDVASLPKAALTVGSK